MGARGVTGTRRGNRESWVPDEPNARGYFEAFVTMGTKPDGQPDRRHVERKSKAARNKAVRELERKRDAGQATKPGRIRTVREMLTRHLDVVLPQRGRAPKTIIGYRSLCEHQIFPRWGGQRIDRLLPEYIEDGYAEMLAAGLAASTIVKVHAILSSAYEIEVRRENVARNPCRLVEPPRLPQADKSGLSIAQARVVLASVEKRRNAARWSAGLACGLRQGEVLGLRWPFLDIDGPDGEPGVMRVWYQLQRLPWRHGCADPAACCERRAQAAVPEAVPEGPAVWPQARLRRRRCERAVQAGLHRARGPVPGADGWRPGVPRDQGAPPQGGSGALAARAEIQGAPRAAEPRAARRSEHLGRLRRRLRPGERPAARPARRLAVMGGHPRRRGHPARGHARHAALGRHVRARRGDRAGRRPGVARALRYPGDSRLRARVVGAGGGRRRARRPGTLRG